MRVELIYAHPVEGSFCSKLRDVAVEALQQSGHEVHLTDLYAEGFSPALSRQERLSYETAAANITGVGAHVERLRWAEGLILIYPTWWYGMPAILKGYFDRVWVPGVAFELDPQGGALRPGLGHIRVMVVVTTYGSPRRFIRLYVRDPGKLVLMRGLGRLLSPRANRLYLAQYGMDRSTPESRGRFIEKVRRSLEGL